MRTAKAKDSTIEVRLTSSDKELIQQAALALGVSVSHLIRTSTLAASERLSD